MIELKNIQKIYGKKAHAFTALSDISFTIPNGASVAIVGKSGSGKSTLMHVMSGLDRLTGGDVVIDGRSLSKLDSRKIDSFRSKKMGFIFQSFFVQANESCYHNVALALEIAHVSGGERKKRVLEALKQVELDDKVESKAKNLSGGQKQRLAIARAIVNKPKILFADEPTGNLDSATSDTIENLLFGINKQLKSTLIIVTHDQELADRCDTQVYLKDGQLQKISGKGATS